LQSRYPGSGALEHIKVDVTNEAEVASSLDAIVEATHRLDGLIANAGITAHKAALDFSQAEVERLWRINV
jgi:NAD(P)-dependent dehydrogenase (short-subunit alcohol dehydrogenase family)